jgi:L-fucose isomerase-like protein
VNSKKQSFGVIVSTRSFFPGKLVKDARNQIEGLLGELGYGIVMVGEEDTNLGAVLTFEEAKACAKLFKSNDQIDGIIVVLPNFGEELGICEAIDLASLKVPVLVAAIDDDLDKLDMSNRRDAFCGKISVCNNLYQRGIPFSLTKLHTCKIQSDSFKEDISRFAAVCRIVKGLRGARIAMLGARPIAFGTVRYSEKLLQSLGIAVQTVDFSEIIFQALKEGDPDRVKNKVAEIQEYGEIAFGDLSLLEKQAKLCLAIEDKVSELECDASTVQCWDSVQNNYGCATCLSMSMMGQKGKPSACESDVMGAVSMLAATLAAEQPSALLDWNNNLGEDRDECICLHCSNFPKDFFRSKIEIECLDVLGSTLGKENCFGACKGQAAPGEVTFLRLTTDDRRGTVKAYVGEGEILETLIPTKGGVAGVRVKNLQGLLKRICEAGFEHHVCLVRGKVADVLQEALEKYMGVEVYRHS